MSEVNDQVLKLFVEQFKISERVCEIKSTYKYYSAKRKGSICLLVKYPRRGSRRSRAAQDLIC